MKNNKGYVFQDLALDITIVYTIGFTIYLVIKYIII